ncbi:MAG: M23 family metallopeptidase [Oscillospiraceae bacterium]|nr:M23 family metallopeptidase [Oscillospiraceae bacterium]
MGGRTSSSRTAGGGRHSVQRDRRRGQNVGADQDRFRLIQLAVSLALFLLVYIGRGVFPAQLEVWRCAAAANVDFRAAFQRFGSALSQGEPVRGALETLCYTLLGGEVELEEPPSQPADDKPAYPSGLLSRTPGGGLSYLNSHGILEGTRTGKTGDEAQNVQPSPSQPAPDQEPTKPAIETAVAQEYTEDGVKLPRNVSMAFYELGLSETAVPVSGVATSGFGYRDSPIDGEIEFHLALDIAAEEGDEIGAFSSGVVEYIGESDEFGNYLKIRHENNVSSFYAHCSKLLVHKGDQVDCGQTVALVGQTGNATGPHLHLTIEKDNIRLDPAYYVDLP